MELLKKIAGVLKENSQIKVVIIGHTDADEDAVNKIKFFLSSAQLL